MPDRRHILFHSLADLADRTPDAPAMLDVDGRVVSFAELRDLVMRWAASYARLGVSAGETVLTMVPNSFESYYAWLGLSWLRAIEVPANTQYRGHMLAHVLNDSEAKVAVIAERYLDRIGDVADDLVHLKRVVVPDATGPIPDFPFDVCTKGDFFVDDSPAALGEGPEYYDVAAIIYTSGTTGPSKGVLVPWAEVRAFASGLPPDLASIKQGLYSTYPAFHLSGKFQLYYTVSQGSYLVIRETFSVSEFWNDIRKYECHGTSLAGPMAALLMLQAPGADDADNPLQAVSMAPVIPNVEEFRSRFGVRVSTGFGMTEVGLPLTSDGWNLANGRSCGRVRAGYQVRIVNDHDEPVPTGQMGELVVRSDEPWVMNAGYWKQPEKTAAAWRNGWFHTGDGFMEDEDGNLYFVDRMKDSIRRRGENISSFEVEACINRHPAVQDSAVIGVPSELGEDDVKAVVVLRPDGQLEPAALIDWLIPRLPRFMIPRYIEFADSLPKTPATFRTQKARLREGPINEQTWDREGEGQGL